MKVTSLNSYVYGAGKQGRYRCMKDEAIVDFFMDQGWKPKFTLRERNAEVERLMREDEISREDAEFMVDDEIQSDLEYWLMTNFNNAPVS